MCGICCRNIGSIAALKSFNLGNGTCKYLCDNLCSIYNDRPDICRVDVMYKKYFSKQYSFEEFTRLNLEGCRKLQRGEDKG